MDVGKQESYVDTKIGNCTSTRAIYEAMKAFERKLIDANPNHLSCPLQVYEAALQCEKSDGVLVQDIASG